MLDQLLDLADRTGIAVEWRPMPPSTGGGACTWTGGGVTVQVDPHLDDETRATVLAHELGHALDGMPLLGGAHQQLRDLVERRAEQAADRRAAAITVDPSVVQRAADTVHDLGGAITAEELAAELEVPVALARRAVEAAWGHEVTRRRQAARAEQV